MQTDFPDGRHRAADELFCHPGGFSVPDHVSGKRPRIAYINCAIDEGNLRPGLDAILRESGSEGNIDASSLAFRVAPRINAAGRMGSAYRALKLLLSQNIDEAAEIAREISEANAQRQAIEGDITKEAINIIEKNPAI